MKILDVFGKGKKAKNQKDGHNGAADEAPEYQLPYFLDDDKKKKTKKNSEEKADSVKKVDPQKPEEKKPWRKQRAAWTR